MELSTDVCQACKSELRSLENRGYNLTSCKHGFCKPCLGAIVADRLCAHRSDQDGSLVTCPVEGCRHALSRQDMRFVVGPDILGLLDEHVMQLLTQNVICPLLGRCTTCKGTLLLSAHKLNTQELRNTFQCNGLDNTLSASRVDLVWPLQDVLLCPKCFLILCDKCGTRLASLTDAPHQCDPLQKKCFDFARSIVKLCFAYVQATQSHESTRVQATQSHESKIKATQSHESTCVQATQSHESKIKATKSWLFSFFRRNNNAQNMQRLSSTDRELRPSVADSDRELRPSLADRELVLKSVINWYHEDGFEERIQGLAFKDLKADDGNQAVCGSFSRKTRRMAFDANMDKQAQAALQELTSSILEMLKQNQGALPPSIVALLCSHSLPYKLLKWLVRNDSVVHITARSDLYLNVLSFLRALSSSWDLLPLLCNPQLKYDCWVAESRWETPGSVMADFEKLFKQAQFMLRRDEHCRDNEEARPGITTLVADIKATYELLCNRIKVWEEKTSQHEWLADTSKIFGSQIASALGCEEARLVPDKEHQLLHNQIKSLICRDDMSMLASSSSSNSTKTHMMPTHHHKNDAAPPGPPSAALVEAYKKALQPLQFDEGCLLPSHYFRKDVERSKSIGLNKRRALIISNEMMQLNTALPLEWQSSIFLRMDEQHTDVLRALIIGPEGTPYENGIFLFDLLLGVHYPDVPPEVRFLTTGAGKVSFNPNLYANGKVCLSILGTMMGPGWKAGESSILQVLVSIQALVMVADPYYNEVFSTILGSRSCADAYILEQRYNTLVHSLLPALTSPDPVFKPVIHAHCRLKAPYILRQCNAWIEEETRSAFKKSLRNRLQKLRAELQKLTNASPLNGQY